MAPGQTSILGIDWTSSPDTFVPPADSRIISKKDKSNIFGVLGYGPEGEWDRHGIITGHEMGKGSDLSSTEATVRLIAGNPQDGSPYIGRLVLDFACKDG